MKTYLITVGLGRLMNHYTRTLEIEGETEQAAIHYAKCLFNRQLDDEIGKSPIRNKIVNAEILEVLK